MSRSRAALSRMKSWASRPLSPRLYWNVMGKLKPVPAVTSEFSTVEECLASGQAVVELLDRLCALRPSAVTLHIGSGLGRVEYHLAQRVRRCFGADISPSMVERARALVPYDNVEFVSTDGKDLGRWADGSLDLVYSFLVFQHVPRPQFYRYVTEAARTLSPGGHFVFQLMIDEAGAAPDPPASHPYALRFYRRADVVEALEQAGFDDVVLADPTGAPLVNGSLEGDVVFCATKPARGTT